jgi:hypothetical protein
MAHLDSLTKPSLARDREQTRNRQKPAHFFICKKLLQKNNRSHATAGGLIAYHEYCEWTGAGQVQIVARNLHLPCREMSLLWGSFYV